LPRPEIEKKRQSYDKRQTNKRNATDENKKYKTVWFNGLRLRFRRVAPLFFFLLLLRDEPKKKINAKKSPSRCDLENETKKKKIGNANGKTRRDGQQVKWFLFISSICL